VEGAKGCEGTSGVTRNPVTRLGQAIKSRLSAPQLTWARRRLVEPMRSFFAGHDLSRLALIYGSDKWGEHWYTQHYEHHFGPLRRKRITLLEIGIGGYSNPYRGGGSLRMWRKYFPHGRIYGVDIHDKRSHNGRRIRTFQGDQNDEMFLRRIIDQIGKADVVIDDGSHVNSHVIKTFQILFPLLAEDGIYVVEDTQTAYDPNYGGNSEDLNSALTTMGMLKRLVDGLNYQELLRPGYLPSYFDQHVFSLHFYHNLVFVHKGITTPNGGSANAACCPPRR